VKSILRREDRSNDSCRNRYRKGTGIDAGSGAGISAGTVAKRGGGTDVANDAATAAGVAA
tara:strand:+ start:363 stop:542 length:180 start_codon:yes stop_codon:yes gene_type:complete